MSDVVSIIGNKIPFDFYIRDEADSFQFRKSIGFNKDVWFSLQVVPKTQYHKWHERGCKLDMTQDNCLIGNARLVEESDIIDNMSYMYYFDSNYEIADIKKQIEIIAKEFGKFLNQIGE